MVTGDARYRHAAELRSSSFGDIAPSFVSLFICFITVIFLIIVLSSSLFIYYSQILSIEQWIFEGGIADSFNFVTVVPSCSWLQTLLLFLL